MCMMQNRPRKFVQSKMCSGNNWCKIAYFIVILVQVNSYVGFLTIFPEPKHNEFQREKIVDQQFSVKTRNYLG